MRIINRDILAILRRFRVADDDDIQRQIDHVKHFNPSPHNTLIAFRFKRIPHFILFDDGAEDDADYIIGQVHAIKPSIEGDLILNPEDENSTYGLPFKGKAVYLFVSANQKKRLDVYLSEQYPDKSRSAWQKHIKAGNVSINDVEATQVRQEVSLTDRVVVSLPEASERSNETLPILHLDEDIIVVDKPAGILTHSKGELDEEFTVADFFRRYTNYGINTNRPGVVHRLDRDTSGVIVGARHDDAAKSLQKQFADRKVNKTYLAVLDDRPNPETAVIELPIGRNPALPSSFRVDPSGKPATTIYRTIATNTSGQSLVELKPKTGRTHQLRVHMAHLGAPIRGDRVYGVLAERLFLHASELEVTMQDGSRKVFSSKPPSDFEELFPDEVAAR